MPRGLSDSQIERVTQALLAQFLTGARDGVAVYYRSRPLALSLGLDVDDALASTMMREGSMSGGRDIGVVFNLPRPPAATGSVSSFNGQTSVRNWFLRITQIRNGSAV